MYRVGTLPTALVPTPDPSLTTRPANWPTPTPTPAPASFQDAIPTAVSAWNNLVSTTSPRVLFCEEGTTNSDCNNRNKDDYVITFKVVAGDPKNWGPPQNHTDCGASIACVKPADPETYGDDLDDLSDEDKIKYIFANNAPRHLGDLVIFIEDPAWEFIAGDLESTQRYWSNDKKVISPERAVPVGDRLYLPSLLMHEFGHTAGLMHPPGGPASYPAYDGLMGLHYSYAEPSSLDVQKMIDTYLGHTSHELPR